MDLRVAAKIGENRPLGRWNVISLDRQKRGCIEQDSSEPPVCSHFADRTNNFMNVVAPSLICACVPHVLWISRWFCQSYSWKIDFWTLKVIHQRMETAAAPYVSHLATSKRDISRHSSQSRRNAGENSKQLSLRRMTYVRDNHVYIRQWHIKWDSSMRRTEWYLRRREYHGSCSRSGCQSRLLLSRWRSCKRAAIRSSLINTLAGHTLHTHTHTLKSTSLLATSYYCH